MQEFTESSFKVTVALRSEKKKTSESSVLFCQDHSTADWITCCFCPQSPRPPPNMDFGAHVPLNLFGPEPTVNAQIVSFHRDSRVSRAVHRHQL